MKWIKGTWDETKDVIFVNPQYITAVDTGRQLFWAQDCDIAVHYEETELPLILKIAGLTEEEARDPTGNTNTNPKEKHNAK